VSSNKKHGIIMVIEFDRERAVRIVTESADAFSEMLTDHQSDETYTSPEEMLKKHLEIEADYDTAVKLKEHLERDCE
jgi:hypothetical protein